jgi:hypothetical protein
MTTKNSPMNGISPPLKNMATTDEVKNINSRKRHAEKNTDKYLLKIIRYT